MDNDSFVIYKAGVSNLSRNDDSQDYRYDLPRRLKVLVRRIGDDKSVEVTGKSARQLKRYFSGDEPPFGVLKSLTEYSGATLDWLAFGRASTATDHELAIVVAQEENREFEGLIKKTDSIAEIEHFKELIHLNRRSADLADRWLKANERWIKAKDKEGRPWNGLSESADPFEAVPATVTSTAAPAEVAKFTMAVLKEVRAVVGQTYKELGVTLAADAISDESERRTQELLGKLDRIGDLDEARSLLPWLQTHIRRELQENRAAGLGTGKREAS